MSAKERELNPKIQQVLDILDNLKEIKGEKIAELAVTVMLITRQAMDTQGTIVVLAQKAGAPIPLIKLLLEESMDRSALITHSVIRLVCSEFSDTDKIELEKSLKHMVTLLVAGLKEETLK